MNLVSKFDIGQIVYPIHRGYETTQDDCPLCGDTDEVTLTTGQRVQCPEKYRGDHRPTLERWWPWAIDGNGIGRIGSIEIHEVGPDHVGLRAEDIERHRRERVRYMIDATGVGTGRVYYEPDLCASREEALAECERRNADEDGCQPTPAWNGPNKCKACQANAWQPHKRSCKHFGEIQARVAARNAARAAKEPK